MKVSTTINLQTYSCELVITITDTLKKESDRIYKKYKLTDEEEEDGENEGILITPSIAKYYLLTRYYAELKLYCQLIRFQ